MSAGSPSKMGSIGAGLDSARARLEHDTVELLMRQKQELEAECDRLRTEVEKKAESFKLAWQEERSAHQRDTEASAAARVRADEEGQRMAEELRVAREELQRLASSSDSEIARVRKALDAARAAHHTQAREATPSVMLETASNAEHDPGGKPSQAKMRSSQRSCTAWYDE